MSNKRRFEYSLQPVLLTRKWDHDALLSELNEVNSLLAEKNSTLADIKKSSDLAAEDWSRLSNASHHLNVDSFTVLTRYIHDLASQRLAQELEIAAVEERRDLLISRVVASQRGVESVEQHRDQMKEDFVKLRLSGDFKEADDHWSTLQAGTEKG